MDAVIVGEKLREKKWVSSKWTRSGEAKRQRHNRAMVLLKECGVAEIPVGCKQCKKCRAIKPTSEFYAIKYVYKPGCSGFRSWCKECDTKENRRARSTLRGAEYHRNYRLRMRFGITAAEYDEMFDRQGGLCAICGNTQTEKKLAVDHDHKTGRIRGLLCTHCNVAIGKFGDSAVTVERALNYLKQHSGDDCGTS